MFISSLRRGIPLAVVSLALLAGCSTLNVRSDASATGNLGSCHTWSWIEPPAAAARVNAFGNPINDQRLRDAIAQRLQSRGMTLAAAGATADCQVAYSAGTRTSVDNGVNRPRFTFGFGTGWGWRNSSFGSLAWDTGYPYAYSEHRVALDVFQGTDSSRKALWHASVDMDLSHLSGAEAEKRIDAAVAAMFAKYPAAR